MDTFKKALEFVLQAEGGYSNDKDDRGGATNYGITHYTYRSFLANQGLPKKSVKLITKFEAERIYKSLYWNPAHCDEMPDKLAICVFDWAVNSGVRKAIMELQQIINAIPDGKYGPKTAEALQKELHDAGEPAIMRRYLARRNRFYRNIAIGTQKKFLRGWLNRINNLQKFLESLGD